MAKTLDFNKVNRPVLHLIMQDDDRTQIKVSVPTEALVSELDEVAPQLQEVLSSGDSSMVEAAYDLAARLINCNRSSVTVTAEELRGKFRMNLETLIIFFGAYVDFISEITNAKN
jgi:hypothetical protein